MCFITFLADKLKFINDLSKMDKSTAEMIKNKIRSELRSGLEKDKILTDEDAKLIKQFLDKDFIRTKEQDS